MSLQRMLIRLLDRPSGRWLLSALATKFASRAHEGDIRVSYDDVWLHTVDGTCIPDQPHFAYFGNSFANAGRALARALDEARQWWFHTYTPQAGDVIVDVGAGIGLDTLAFSRAVGPTGRVIAIEAHPLTFRRLQKLCEHNQLENVTCCQFAVMDAPGSVFIDDSAADASNAVSRMRRVGQLPTPVRADTLDAILARQGVDEVDLLKMNIEGAERDAIRGMGTTIARTHNICIACHDFKADGNTCMSTRGVVEPFLRDAGFEVVTRDDHPIDYVRDHVHGRRPVATPVSAAPAAAAPQTATRSSTAPTPAPAPPVPRVAAETEPVR